LEETLTLHRLGLFEKLGKSLKTSNSIESVMSLIEQGLRKLITGKTATKSKDSWPQHS
jgi:hypothetical protein